jgi:predicted small secreted protein
MKVKALIAAILGAFILSACNTMEGVGRDTQAAGKKVEKEAVEHKPSNR